MYVTFTSSDSLIKPNKPGSFFLLELQTLCAEFAILLSHLAARFFVDVLIIQLKQNSPDGFVPFRQLVREILYSTQVPLQVWFALDQPPFN